jgi:hypothetical protein
MSEGSSGAKSDKKYLLAQQASLSLQPLSNHSTCHTEVDQCMFNSHSPQ